MDDQDWLVREQVAATFGALTPNARVPAMALLLARHGDDPITVDAAISGVRGQESAVIERLLASASQSPMIENAVAMLAATVIRAGDDRAAAAVLGWTAEDARPEWQRSALLQGAEIALLGSSMPGSAPRASGRGAANAAPCATCPGARGGPGGAQAFPAGRGAAPAASGRGANGGPRLRLSEEPAAFETLASAKTNLGARAAKVIARVDWAAKPGAAQQPAPLTPEEQQRFTAGEQVYKNLCQACHQPDGKGQERMGANLIGSPFALAAPDVAARIVLNGKVGSVGWMPPLSASLTDDQIAGALTYVRRSWGNSASPIDPAVVKQVREQTSARTSPWTEDELRALMK
jgi:mono/diheme cytochrome c family protein